MSVQLFKQFTFREKGKFMDKAESMLEALVHDQLLGVEIYGDEGYVRLNFTHGFIEIDGDDMELYVELDEVN